MSLNQLLDHIERETTIAAPQSTVWGLITQPGWWINNGVIVPHHTENDDPGHVIVHDPDHGRFAVAVVDQQPEMYAAFRWYSGPSESRRTGDLAVNTSTLVEFFLSSADPTTTVLRVVESGFAQLDEQAQQRRVVFEENSKGWDMELTAAREHLEGLGR